MARPSQQSSVFDDRRDRDRLPPHYKESYRLAIDVLVERGRDAFRDFLQREGTVPFLSEQEVDHIESTFQSPAVTTRGDDGDEVGQDFGSSSSGTYWPVYSDTSAPDLELGWPAPGRFLGQTNVTLHFHPPLGNGVPTIKEVIRRHIRGASKVVAVVMDVFTDVDIFQELLEAANVRRVPVYVLHDRLNFPLFHDMCLHHGLRAGELENVRVRTLPGSLYFCKSGAKFHGQVFEKFMLFDCVTALCGSYSLTWSHEKIHRSLVHEFTGEMVETFDEEFRVLYAQSSCPYGDSSALAIPSQVPPPTRGLQGLQGLRGAPHLGLALQIEKHDSSVDSWVSSTSSRRALDQQTLNFTHHDFMRRPIDSTYARMEAQHLRREDRYTFTAKQEVLSEKEYRGVANVSQRFVANAQVFAGEKEVWKRYSYAGEATESHSFLQRIQDPYSFASGRGALEPRPRNIGGVLPGQEFRRLQGGAGAYGDRFGEGRGDDVFGDDGAAFPDSAGNAKRITAAAEEEARDISQQQQLAPYNQRKKSEFPAQHLMNSRREAWQGQPGKADGGRSGAQQTFACQTSPTQTQSFQEEGPFAKAGAASRAREGDAGGAEKSAKQGLRRWRINSFLSSCENPAEAEAGRAEDDPRLDGEARVGEGEARSGEGRGSPAADAAVAGFADGLTRHESLRSKISPMLQRNSRLRSSLIFNSARQDAGASEQIAKRGPGNSGGAATAADDKPPAGPRRADEVAAEAPAGGSSNAAELKEKDEQTAVALPASDLQSKYAPREPFVRSRFLFSSLTNRKAATATAEEEVRAASDKVGPVARPDSHIKELFPKPQPLAESRTAPAGSAVSKMNPSPGSEQTKLTQIQQRNETIPARSKSSSSSADTGAQVTRRVTDSAAQDVKPDPASDGASRASTERASRLQELLDKTNNKNENSPEKASPVNATVERASPREPCRPSAPPAASPTSAKVPPAQDAASGVSRAPATIGTSELSPSPAWRSSSTSTPVLYGSNLKDDTKVMLEQISLSSHKYKDDNHKVARGDDSARLPRDAAGGGGSSVASPKEAAPSQASPTTTAPAADEDRSDELIRNLESKRKENRAYSRFEVFYKTEGTEAKPKGVSPVVSPVHVPDQSRYVPDRNRAMEQPLSNSLLQKIKVTFKGKN